MDHVSSDCWASVLGDCEGAISREHVVSRTLLGKTVVIKGFFLKHERSLAIGRDSFVSKCLCTRHNNLLSECDSEARRFREAVDWWAKGSAPEDAPSTIKRVNGLHLARWFAKTACNIAAVSGKHVPLPFIRYAFAASDDAALFLFFMPQLGDVLEVNRDPSEFHWLRDQGDPDRAAIVCYLFGLPFMLSTFDVRGAESQVCELLDITTSDPTGSFIDRLSAINIGDGPSKRGSIVFEW